MTTQHPTGAVAPAWYASLSYCQAHGLPIIHHEYSRIVLDPLIGRRIAAAYMRAPAFDASAVPAYSAFRDEVASQFDFLTRATHRGGLGIHVVVNSDDPYPNAAAMMHELRENGRLRVYSTAAGGNEHPFLSNDQNDMFRAVHDVFGHAAIGRGFDGDGEEAAWCKHATMFSREARAALATETRGQICTLIYHYHGTRFPDQKMMLLPDEYRHFQRVSLRDRTGSGT